MVPIRQWRNLNLKTIKYEKNGVLMAVRMTMILFSVVMSCRFSHRYQRFGNIFSSSSGLKMQTIGYFSGLITLMMESVSTSKATVLFCETTRHNIPEDSLHIIM
jgi:hypothetical protein